ncbi:sensor histidine kinase [Natrialbaceae archaeon A-arb3/5]
MDHWKRAIRTVGARRMLVALGGLYVVAAIVWGSVRIDGGTPVGNVVVVSTLISSLGLVLLYGGYRLPLTAIDPDFYPTVVGWCFVGLGSMLGMLIVYHNQPADSISNPARAILFLTAFSSTAGLGVGIHDARAKTKAREVEQRNRELQQTKAQLQKTVSQLEESNERLEQFAYAASHDLQEPLRMVSSYLQLIERRADDELDEECQEFLSFAVDGSERMRRMIEALLEYSRVETQGESFESVDLDAVFADVCSDLQVKIDDHDAEITAESLPRVDGDERQLRQVFQNLVENAIEYNGDEPPRVRVSATRNGTGARNGTTWTVAVQDEGIGIDPDDQDRIFDVFHRLHSHEEHAGTGIGLALCERIVERHGGEIWVESEPGEGATFSVTLPAADRSA